MWTAENRGTYDHKTKRYPSDLTDEEWALVEPHLPPPTKGRRHPALERRQVMNAILYVLTTGCQWRQLPRDFPSKSAVHKYLIGLQHDGVLTRIHDALYGKVREEAGKAPTPTLSIVCVIRAKSATDSDAIRPPVPTEVGHLFRSNPATPSRWV